MKRSQKPRCNAFYNNNVSGMLCLRISGNSFESGGLTPSTEEFRQYVVEEFSRSSKAIENKFVEFVHLRYATI